VVVWKVITRPDGVTLLPAQGMLMPLQAETIKLSLTEAVDGVQIAMLEIQGGAPVIFEFWHRS
jgi:hypothetical protein